MASASRTPSPDGSPGCSSPEAEDKIESGESSSDEEQPLYVTRDGRRIFAEDIEAEVASGRFAMLGASSASSSSSASEQHPTWDYFVAADSGFGSVAPKTGPPPAVVAAVGSLTKRDSLHRPQAAQHVRTHG